MLVPILILITKKGRRPFPAFIAGILVVIGSWFKRYIIVTPTLLHPFSPMQDVPANYKHYFPTWEEWAIAIGSLAGASLVITIFARIFPIIPIQETITEKEEYEKSLS
jgi:molybdopterin-containing oxidoreductase family membrane subunit